MDPTMRPVTAALLLALASLAALAPSGRAQSPDGEPLDPPAEKPRAPASAPATPPIQGAFGPEAYVAKEASVPVRSEPGFVFREIRFLRRGEEILVDAKQGAWLHVRPEGWVLQDHVVPVAEKETLSRKRLVATRTGARVRETPATTGAVVRALELGEVLQGDGPDQGWWKLEGGGYVSATVVQVEDEPSEGEAVETAPAPDGRPQMWVVAGASANVRTGRGTEFPVVRTVGRGTPIPVTRVDGGWCEVPGGWVRQDLLQAPAADAPAVTRAAERAERAERPPRASPRLGDGPRRWSLVDLNGVLFEVTELGPRSQVAPLKEQLRQTGVLEEDWTYLGLSIGVPDDGEYRFNYDPDRNTTVVVDTSGQKYGNVYARGPVDRMPGHLRKFFVKQTIGPGERFDGLLLFRPTLKVSQIEEVSLVIGGRLQKLYESAD
jgi:uncharacterized protein YgiM (DUF1202 family)